MAHIGFLTERMRLGFGVDLATHKIAQGLVKKGYKVTVFCSFNDGTYHGNDYEIEVIETSYQGINFIYEYETIKTARHFLKNKDIDLFIPQTFPFFSIPIWLRKPYIAFDYGVVSSYGMSRNMKLFLTYMRTTQNYVYHNFAKRIITISNYLKSTFPVTIRRKADTIYLGANHYHNQVDQTEVREFRKKLGVEEDEVLLFYVGRLDRVPYKDLDDLVNIFQTVKINNEKVKMMMAGFGGVIDELRLKFQGIIPLRHSPVDMMPLLFSASDIYTTASKWEGFNLPVVEAQYYGKPVIAYNLCAHPEVVGEGGFLVNSKSEFIDKLIELSNSPDLREEMSQKSKSFSNKFTWEKTVDEFDQILKEVLQ